MQRPCNRHQWLTLRIEHKTKWLTECLYYAPAHLLAQLSEERTVFLPSLRRQSYILLRPGIRIHDSEVKIYPNDSNVLFRHLDESIEIISVCVKQFFELSVGRNLATA
jgi:hypothetical protein